MEATMKRKSEAGQSLLLVALALVVLMGFAGLAIDMGVIRYEKRLQQTAADAAAIAGADNLAHPASGGVTAGAQNASATDGFTDNGGGNVSACASPSAAVGTVCVQVSNGGPTTGPHAGDPKYVEVFVAAVQPTYFMPVLGINQETVTARAVATNVSGGVAGNGCAWTLGSPSGQIEGININGSATLNATSCGIIDNGNFNTKGNKLLVNAGTFGTAGDWSANGTKQGDVTCSNQAGPCPAIKMPASSDPFASMTPPSQPSASSSCPATGACNVTTSGIQALQPGTYSSITVGSNSTANFAPGIYYIDGANGLTVNGGSTICNSTSANCSGAPPPANSGVMFYFTGNATVNMTGNPVVNLTGLTSGTYAGMLMYQDPADTNVGPAPNGPTLGGDSGANFGGVLYFPSDQITFFGNNTTTVCGSGTVNAAMVVSDSIALSGSPTVCLTGPVGLPTGTTSILTSAVLVE
jgi:hypothetical protein